MLYFARTRAFAALAAALGTAACSFDGSGVGIPGASIDASGEADAAFNPDAAGVDTPPPDAGGPDAAPLPDASPDAAPLPDASPDAAVDSDGDGVLDGTDDCPTVANPDQRNHDGDSRGDACDGCPHIAEGSSPPDADGDGVNDACDPRPEADDRIVRFEGFYDDLNGVPAGWASVTGTASDWRVRDGQLQQTSTAANTHLLNFSQALNAHAIDTALRIDGQAAANNVIRSVGVVAGDNRNTNTPRRWLCVLFDTVNDPNEPSLELVDQAGNTLTERDAAGINVAVAVGTTATLRLQLQAAGNILTTSCTMEAAGDTESLGAQDALRAAAGAVGLRTNSVAARFDYVVIYDAAP